MWRKNCLGFAIALFPVACHAQTAPDQRAFAKEMLPRLAEQVPDARLRIDDEDPLVLHIENNPESEGGLINLHRIWEFCANNPRQDCTVVKDEFVANIATRPDDPARGNLRVIVRGQDYLDYLLQIVAESEEGIIPPYRIIGDGLYAFIAIDSPTTIAVAFGDMLSDLDLSEEEGWALAIAQTEAIVPERPTEKQLRNGVLAYQEYEYLPVLLLDDPYWQDMSKMVGPDLFMTATSDYLVVFGIMPSGSEFIDFAEAVAADCRASPRCLSPYIYRWRDGQWVIADLN